MKGKWKKEENKRKVFFKEKNRVCDARGGTDRYSSIDMLFLVKGRCRIEPGKKEGKVTKEIGETRAFVHSFFKHF